MTTRLHQISAFTFGLDLDCWFPKSLRILTSNTRILKTWNHTCKNFQGLWVFDNYSFWSLSPKSQIHSFSKLARTAFFEFHLWPSHVSSGQDSTGGPHGNGFFWLEDHSGFTFGFLQIVAELFLHNMNQQDTKTLMNQFTRAIQKVGGSRMILVTASYSIRI